MLYGTDMRVCTVCGSKLSFSSDDMNARDFFVDRGANLQSSLLHVSPSLSELRAAPDFLSRCFCLGLSPLTPWRASTTSQAGDISANGIVAPGSGTYVAWVSTDNPGRNFKLGLFWEHKLINWQPHHNLLFCIHKQDPRTLLLSAIH